MKARWVLVACLAGCLAATACAKKTPARWTELHLPAEGLEKVLPETDDHIYYADYTGVDEATLWAKVAAAMGAAGYKPACNMFDGHVRGFSKGDEQMAAKIDTLGGLALTVFDAQSKEALLHGACFGKLQLGPAQRIK
jgi:hypothetical protein